MNLKGYLNRQKRREKVNTKIKLDRDELKGLITILINLEAKGPNRNVIEFLMNKEINIMKQKYQAKMMSPSARFSIQLTNYQVSILFELLNECADNFEPFERAIALMIIEQIDKQYMAYRQLLLNFMGEINSFSSHNQLQATYKQLS